MNMNRSFAVAVLFLAGLCAHPQPAHAAETYHTCKGFITTLPTTISTQGVWCMKQDLATAITSGNAVTIATNNVTIDCNDFKLGDLAAGDASSAYGIYASNRQNVTVRHCNLRGFGIGINLSGAGHLVEDNRLDNNLYIGIQVGGDNGTIQRNRVFDTGGQTGNNSATAIDASVDVIDNVVSGVFAAVASGPVEGIDAHGSNTVVSGNRVSGLNTTALDGGAVSASNGIDVYGSHASVTNNRVFGPGGKGIWGLNASETFCAGNTVSGFTTPMQDCADDGGNGLH